MQTLNETLFFLINAPAHPHVMALWWARVLANQLIWLAPLALLVGWFGGCDITRKRMLEAAAAGFLGLLLAQVIGLLWNHPRPFAMGLGHQFTPHAADASFPSDHLTLLWSIALSFLLRQRPHAVRMVGVSLALLGLPMAWARIYLGVHFPLDMLGAALVAGLAAKLCMRQQHWYMEPVFVWTSGLHRRLFAPLIRRGWVRQ